MNLRRIVPASAVIAAAAIALAGCSASGPAPAPSDDGRIKVVAVTDVWGDIVSQIGGDLVSVDSLISGTAQDPHSFEATVQDRLAISEAALVIANGGGYDDFMDTLLGASDGDAAVINAVDISGIPGAGEDGFNEHVWYDFDTVDLVAGAIADQLGTIDPAGAATFQANLAAFTGEVAGLKARADGIATTADGAGVLVTEPVPLYLLTASGFENLTPPAFSEAVEEGTDISPSLLDDVIQLVKGGTIRLFAYNSQTAGPETQTVLTAAQNAGVPVVSFTETLPDGEDYVSWMTANLDAIAAALK